uniref:Uncharacterized protein n=1 Tax=Knipowitschia caucasica TaxID=637954 RepID=A0AAV2K531_KNICA
MGLSSTSLKGPSPLFNQRLKSCVPPHRSPTPSPLPMEKDPEPVPEPCESVVPEVKVENQKRFLNSSLKRPRKRPDAPEGRTAVKERRSRWWSNQTRASRTSAPRPPAAPPAPEEADLTREDKEDKEDKPGLGNIQPKP